jgi:hypothetical protein
MLKRILYTLAVLCMAALAATHDYAVNSTSANPTVSATIVGLAADGINPASLTHTPYILKPGEGTEAVFIPADLDPDTVTTLQGNIDAVKADVANVRADMANLTGQVGEIKSMLAKLTQASTGTPPVVPPPTAPTQPQAPQNGVTWYRLPDGRIVGVSGDVAGCGQAADNGGCGAADNAASSCGSQGGLFSKGRCGPIRRILGRCP